VMCVARSCDENVLTEIVQACGGGISGEAAAKTDAFVDYSLIQGLRVLRTI